MRNFKSDISIRRRILAFFAIFIFTLSLISTPTAIHAESASFSLIIKSVGDNNTYSNIDITIIERFLRKVEETFWDKEFGGYYFSARYGNITDDVKSLAVIARAINAYSTLYNKTKNESYKEKIYELVSFSEKFRNKPSYLYFGFLVRDLSQPYVSNPLFEINGHGSVGSTLLFANSLIYAYKVLKNESLLELAKNISDSTFQELWDPNYGGIYSLADIGEPVKDVGDNLAFFFLNAEIYMISGDERFLDRALKTIEIIDKMWHDGFYHSYSNNLEPLNTLRYPPDKTIEAPAYAYLLAYKLTKNEDYLKKSLRLINASLFYSWDAKYGGVFFYLDGSYKPADSDKGNPLGTIYYLSLIEKSLDEEAMKILLKRRIAGLTKLMIQVYNTTYGFPNKRSLENAVIDYTILAVSQFYAANALLIAEITLKNDKNPPILLDAYVENGDLFIKVIDMEGGINTVKLIYDNSSYLLEYSWAENAFVLESFEGNKGKVEVIDSNGNVAIYEIETGFGLIEVPNKYVEFFNLSKYMLYVTLLTILLVIIILSRKIKPIEEFA